MKLIGGSQLTLTRTKALLSIIPIFLLISFAGFVNVTRASENKTSTPSIVFGQTLGWIDGRIATFTYGRNYVCTGTTTGVGTAPGEEGPGPENFACGVLGSTSPLNLPGIQLDPKDIPTLIVIVPFFSVGGVFQATAAHPTVFVQCPETQSGVAQGTFGHCIFHDTHLHLPTVVLNGAVIPLPNHTHIVNEDIGGTDQPWVTKVVLVFNPAIWPDPNGDCPAHAGCLTSFNAISSAKQGTDLVGPVSSNLILFFGVQTPS